MKIRPDRPWRLQPDNFTPPTRTPWGGRKIVSCYKRNLGLALPKGTQVGESWEVSVEPSFPSRFERSAETLADAIGSDPVAWLGNSPAKRYGNQTPLLVKLLDAADNLSVQVHPSDEDPSLKEGESGKPESWFILEAEPGCGLYLGFRQGVTEQDVARCIQQGGALNELMNFVEVSTGDFFRIEAGTPHAIGRGITLVEPQFVKPGCRGVTYRYWDWNRRYDAAGRPDPGGTPRELHVERSLGVTRWNAPRGEAFVQTCRCLPTVLYPGPLRRERLLDWRWFEVERWQGSGTMEISNPGSMWALVCVQGTGRIEAGEAPLDIQMGQSCVVPCACADLRVHGEDLCVVATHSGRADA